MTITVGQLLLALAGVAGGRVLWLLLLEPKWRRYRATQALHRFQRAQAARIAGGRDDDASWAQQWAALRDGKKVP